MMDIDPLLTPEQITAIADKLLHPDKSAIGTMGDPHALLTDALGRFEEVPEEEHWDNSTKQSVPHSPKLFLAGSKCPACRAMHLCGLETKGGHQVGRFTVRNDRDRDVVIVLHPLDRKVNVIDDDGNIVSTKLVENWLVFVRSMRFRQNATCYTCEADKKRMHSIGVRKHKCWKGMSWDVWVPELYAKAVSLDDAEELAKEMVNSMEMTRESELDGWDGGHTDWSREVELPFSPEIIGYVLADRENHWNSLSSE